MLNVYMCDLTHTGLGINANTFPLGLGSVTSYLLKKMDGKVKCKLFKFPDKLNTALEQKIPDVLCMSYYSWNANLTYAFAKHVKKINPKTLIVFGGPEFSLEKNKREKNTSALRVARAEIRLTIHRSPYIAVVGTGKLMQCQHCS